MEGNRGTCSPIFSRHSDFGPNDPRTARSLLKSMSVKQGIKYDAPESAKDIPAFIEFHKLDTDEILDPVNSFKTFNQFFYRCACPCFTGLHAYLLPSPRKLKPDARPVENSDDPNRLVSGADCRLMAFENVNEATRVWIKGREFSVARLLGQAYAESVDKYNGGALCVFRLAPQDYHRFHTPVDGKIGKMTYISGEYYTVNVSDIPAYHLHTELNRRGGLVTLTSSHKPSEPLSTSMGKTHERSYRSTARNLDVFLRCVLEP